MNADELLGPVGRRREARDRQRRGVGGEDRVRLQRRAKLGVDLALDVFLLGRRPRSRDRNRRHRPSFPPAEMRFSAACRCSSVIALLGDLARHVAVDGRQRLLHAVGRDVVESSRRNWPARRHGRCRCPSGPRRSRRPCECLCAMSSYLSETAPMFYAHHRARYHRSRY